MRYAIVLLAATTFAAGAVSTALASSGTGAGGDFAVSVSLSPDVAATGDLVTASESITNVTSAWRLARITQTLVGPAGVAYSVSYPLLVPPGRTLSLTVSYRVPEFVPRGVYTLTFTAANARGTATASASIEFV